MLATVFFLLSFLVQVHSQNSWRAGTWVEADVFYGQLVRHSPKMEFDIPYSARGVGLSIMKQSRGQDYWSAAHGAPRFGVQVFWRNFGNDELLGRTIGFYPQGDFFLHRSKRWEMYCRAGFGLTFNNRPYNRLENPENNAIGSMANNATAVGLGVGIRLTPQWLLRLEGNATHVSNGRFSLPNLGLNTFSLKMGISYQLAPLEEITPIPQEKLKRDKKWHVNLRFGLGAKENKEPDGPRYPVFLASAFMTRMISYTNRLQLGVEVFHDQSVRAFTRNQQINSDEPQFTDTRFAVIAGQEFVFGHAAFMTQLFFYADKPFEGSDFFGTRIGPTFYLYGPADEQRFCPFIGIYMKAHKAVADYIEVTAGIRW